MAEAKTPRTLFYGWVVVGITFLIMSVSYAIWYSFSIFYVPILDEFGWTRAETALIFSIGSVVYGFGSAISGALLDRFGPKKTFAFAAAMMTLGLLGCSQVKSLWQFFLFWGILVSFGVCMAGYVPCVALVSNWFSIKRATAVGIAQAGGRESFLMVPVIQTLIMAVGWRDAYLLLGTAAAVFIILPSQFLKHYPEQIGLMPDGMLKPGVEARDTNVTNLPRRDRAILDAAWVGTDWTLIKALKQYRFWAIFMVMAGQGAGYGIVMTHQVAYMTDIGFPALFASFIILLYGIASMCGRLCGFVSDLLGREITYFISCLGIITGFSLLLITRDPVCPWMLYLYALCFGFFSGLASPAYASAVADLFSGRHFGAILGFANIGFGLGTSVGSWLDTASTSPGTIKRPL